MKGSHLLLHNGLVGLAHESGRTLEIWEYHDVTGFRSIAKHTHIGFHPKIYTFDRAQDVLVLLENVVYAGPFCLRFLADYPVGREFLNCIFVNYLLMDGIKTPQRLQLSSSATKQKNQCKSRYTETALPSSFDGESAKWLTLASFLSTGRKVQYSK